MARFAGFVTSPTVVCFPPFMVGHQRSTEQPFASGFISWRHGHHPVPVRIPIPALAYSYPNKPLDNLLE